MDMDKQRWVCFECNDEDTGDEVSNCTFIGYKGTKPINCPSELFALGETSDPTWEKEKCKACQSETALMRN